MRLPVLSLLGVAVCAMPSAAAREAAPGILMIQADAGTARHAVPLLRLLRDRLAKARTFPALDSLVHLPWKDDACAAGQAEAGRDAILAAVREGADRFFRQTDLAGGAGSLSQGLDAFFEHPCRIARTPEDLGEVCRAAVLLVSVRLKLDRQDEAAALARRIAEVLPEPCVSAVDTPPEVAAFLAGLRRDVEAGRAERVISIVAGGPAESATLVVDGRPQTGAAPWRVRLPSGKHEFTFLTTQGDVLTATPMIRPDTSGLDFDLRIPTECGPGPEGTILCPAPADPTSLARRLASSTRTTVLVVRGLGASEGIRVTSIAADAPDAEVLRVHPPADATGKAEVIVPDGSPLTRKAVWPWPFLAAGASAGLLVSGVILNMKSNEAAAAVNRGVNRESDRARWKTAAVACYAVSAGAAGAAVLLEIFRPAPETRYFVPLPALDGSVGLGVSGRF